MRRWSTTYGWRLSRKASLDASRWLLLCGEAEYLAQACPFGWKIEQPGDPHAVREACPR